MQHAGIVIDDSYCAHDETIIGRLQLSPRQKRQGPDTGRDQICSSALACNTSSAPMSFWHYAKSTPVAKGAQTVAMANRQISGLHFNPQLRPHVLEHDGDRLDDQLTRVRLAVDDNLVLRLF